MLVKLKELREKRNQLITEARSVLEAKAAGYDAKYDQIHADIEKLDLDVEREERQIEAERKLSQDNLDAQRNNPPRIQQNPETTNQYRSVVEHFWERGGRRSLSPEEARIYDQGDPASPRSTPECRAAFNRWAATGIDTPELRAMAASSDTAGGFLIPPEQFVNDLIMGVDDQVFIRQLATKYRLTAAASLGVPTLDTDISDTNWTDEVHTGTEDTSIAFGKRALYPHPLAKLIRVSNTLLRQAAQSAEAIIRQRMAYKFGTVEEAAFLSGTGVQRPLGVFVASASGIPVARDVATGNSATAIGADGLIDAKFSLRSPYWTTARWIFSRTAIRNIRKLKDGEGQYLWQSGLVGGIPDRILEVPYYISEFCPATFTTGLYVGIIGDFSKYWIADALDMQIQRLNELYAASNQIGFIGRIECDGMPVLAEAFARVTLA